MSKESIITTFHKEIQSKESISRFAIYINTTDDELSAFHITLSQPQTLSSDAESTMYSLIQVRGKLLKVKKQTTPHKAEDFDIIEQKTVIKYDDDAQTELLDLLEYVLKQTVKMLPK
jgi:hypothetical protein